MKSLFLFLVFLLTQTAFSLTPEENIENARKFVADVLEQNDKNEKMARENSNEQEHDDTERHPSDTKGKESKVIYVRTVNDNPIIFLSRPKISHNEVTSTPANPHFIDENKEDEGGIAIIHDEVRGEVQERKASEEEDEPDKSIAARTASRDDDSDKTHKIAADYFTEYIIEDDIAYDNLVKRLGSFSHSNNNHATKLEYKAPLVEDRDDTYLNDFHQEHTERNPEVNIVNATRTGDVGYLVNDLELVPAVPEIKPCQRTGACKQLNYYKTYYQAMLNRLIWKYWNVVQGSHAVQKVLTDIRTMQNYLNYLNNLRTNYVFQPLYRHRSLQPQGYRRG